MLTEEKGLPLEFHSEIWKKKQDKTISLIPSVINFDSKLIQTLKDRGLKVYCASNSIQETIHKTCVKAVTGASRGQIHHANAKSVRLDNTQCGIEAKWFVEIPKKNDLLDM